MDFLKAHAGAKVFEAKLEDLLPRPVKKVQDSISSADLVLITSQEIDAMGEENNVSLARQTMDEILRQLRKAFRILGQLGVKTIVFTADHGHLFADELGARLSAMLKPLGVGPHIAEQGGEIACVIIGIAVVLIVGSIWRRRAMRVETHSA